MKILMLDTAFDKLNICLSLDGENFYSESDGKKKHNGILLPLIDSLLEKSKIKISDIDILGVNVGPGSFTGIRLGVCTVNAFAYALNKKIVEVNSFELVALSNIKNYDYNVLIDCMHGNFYGAKMAKNSVNILENREYNENEINAEKDIVLRANECYDKENLIKSGLNKYKNKEFTDFAKPLYLKKSQAERGL